MTRQKWCIVQHSMTISKKIRTIAVESLNKVHDVDAKIKKLESERDFWHKSGYEAQMNALRAERQNLLFEANRRLDAAKASYAERLKKLYTPTAEALTVPDRAVLDSGISLTERDIEELFDRNAGNPSFQKLILERAEKNGIQVSRCVTEESEKLKGFDMLRSYYNTALTPNGETHEIALRNNAMFEKIIPQAIRGDSE